MRGPGLPVLCALISVLAKASVLVSTPYPSNTQGIYLLVALQSTVLG